jgi:integrase
MARRIYDELRPFHIPYGFLFTPRQSEHTNRYRFDPKRALLMSLDAAELGTDAPFQKLRHTFGSILAQQGVSIYKIAEWMGHESVSTTRRHYAALQAYDAEIEALK